MTRTVFGCVVVLLAVAVGIGALEEPRYCPACKAPLSWDGQVRVDGEEVLYHYTCFCGFHTWSTAKPQRSTAFGRAGQAFDGASQRDSGCSGLWGWGPDRVICATCGAAACFTGEIRFVNGRTVRVYRCLAGHETVGN